MGRERFERTRAGEKKKSYLCILGIPGVDADLRTTRGSSVLAILTAHVCDKKGDDINYDMFLPGTSA